MNKNGRELKMSKKWISLFGMLFISIQGIVPTMAEELVSEEIITGDIQGVEDAVLFEEENAVSEIEEMEPFDLDTEDSVYEEIDVPEITSEDDLAEVGVSGKWGNNITWDLTNGVLTLSGTGNMEELNGRVYPWLSSKSIKTVIIEPGITNIGTMAFSGLSNLTSVSIPDTVKAIGNNAFHDCSELHTVTIPSSVTTIENDAFSYCASLESIMIPESVKTIGQFAFQHCDKLTTVKLPSSITVIPHLAFLDCYSLVNIQIPEKVIKIEQGAFSGCSSLKNLKLPDGLTSIEAVAFRDCSSLTSMKIPDGVEGISSGVFKGCSSMTSITIPETLKGTALRDEAFAGCSSLKSITIPAGVNYISYSAFEGCTSIESIVIPSNVKGIYRKVFKDCTKLKTIEFRGNAPETIDDDIFENVTATAYYPSDKSGWTSSVRKNYGGKITWVSKVMRPDLRSAVINRLYNSSKGGDLGWKTVADAEKYNIYRTNNGKTVKIATVKAPTTSYMDTSIKDGCWGKVYVYYVQPESKGVQGPRGEGKTLQRLSPMKITSITNNASSKVTVKWQVLSGSNKANGYEVQYAESTSDLYAQKGSFKKISLNGRNNLSKVISGLSKGQTYYFRVRAYVNYTHSVTKVTTKTWSQYSNVASIKITK